MIEPELNFYYSDYKNKGSVYLFGSPAFNDLNYNMPIHSTRLMLDGALTVASYRRFSTYVIAGIGDAWNRVGYSDAINSGINCGLQNLSLNSTTRSHFVWEAGAGMTYAINRRIELTAEYLFTDFDKQRTSGSGNTGGIIRPLISPASFDLHAQAILLGLHVALG